MIHIFMWLKKILVGKITYTWRRWGTPQNFYLVFTEELQKTTIKKKLLKWSNKKCKNLNIDDIAFFKKNKDTWRYHNFTCVLNILIWSTVLESVTFALLLPFLKTWKIRILKKMKKKKKKHHFLHFHPSNNPKIQNFEKMKKLQISSFYTKVPKIMICYTIPNLSLLLDVIEMSMSTISALG